MSKSIKRVLAMLLSVCMVVGMMPTFTFAAIAESELVDSITLETRTTEEPVTITMTKEGDGIASETGFAGTDPTALAKETLKYAKLTINPAEGKTIKVTCLANASAPEAESEIKDDFGGSSKSGSTTAVSDTLDKLTALSSSVKDAYFKVTDDSTTEIYKITFSGMTTALSNTLGITITPLDPAEKDKVNVAISSADDGTNDDFYYRVTEKVTESESAEWIAEDEFVDEGYYKLEKTKDVEDGNVLTIPDGSYIDIYEVDPDGKVKAWGKTSTGSQDGWTDAPEFKNGNSEYTFETSESSAAKKASFELSNYKDGNTYSVYYASTGRNLASDILSDADDLAVNNNILEITFNNELKNDITLYVAAKEKVGETPETKDGPERTKIVVHPYAKKASTGLKSVKFGETTVDVSDMGSESFATAEEIPVEVDYSYTGAGVTGTITLKDSSSSAVQYSGDAESASDVKNPVEDNEITSSTVRYSKTKPTDGHVWVKVISEDGLHEMYYHFVLTAAAPNDNKSITKISVNGYEGTVASPTTEQDGSTVAKAIPVTIEVPANTLKDAGTDIAVELTVDKTATAKYQIGTASSVGALNYNFGSPTTEKDDKTYKKNDKLGKDQFLYVKVTAEDGSSLIYKVVLEEERFEIEDVEATKADGVTVSAADKSAVTTAVKGTNLNTEDSDTKAALNQAMMAAVKADALSYNNADVQNAIADASGKSVSANDPIYFYAVPYLDVKVADGDYNATDATYKVDITPRYYVVGSTANNFGAVVVDSAVKANINAVKISAAEDKELDLHDVELVITLPDISAFQYRQTVYVKHDSDNAVEDTVKTGRTLNITAKSFSTYTITKEIPGEAMIGDTVYETLQDAIDAVGNDGTIVLTKKAEGKDYSRLTSPAGRTKFKIDKDTNSVDIDLSAIGFVPLTSGSNTYTAEIDKNGNVTVTRTNGGSTPVEPGADGALEFVDPADAEALADMSTTVGTGSADRFTLDLKADDGEDIGAAEDWDVKAASNVIHVTAKHKLRFNKIGRTTVTVTATGKTNGKIYATTFEVNVTKLGIPEIKVVKGSKSKTIKVTNMKKVYGATGIIVRYSRNSDLENDLTGSSKRTYKSNKKQTRTITVKKSKKTYYVKVRAYNSSTKGDWSVVDSAKTK